MTCVSKLVGRLMISMAPNGHFLTHMPHPMQSRSDMKAIFESGVTSMQSLPVRTTGHDFLHSCRHFYGLFNAVMSENRDREYLGLALSSSASALILEVSG